MVSIDSVTMQGTAHLSVGDGVESLVGVEEEREEEEGVGGGVINISSAAAISSA